MKPFAERLADFIGRGLSAQSASEKIMGRNGGRLTPEQMTAAFAVPEDQLQWRATLQAIDEEIGTCLRAAQDLTLNPQGCANEVAAIEHLQRVQQKLHEHRERGLKIGS